MPESYCFGSVEIRPAERLVLIEGHAAALRPRTFDVLLALVQRRDRLVSKGELLDVAWPGVVVEENNLHVQVSALRRLLGARAIATIPGRGYRFTLPASSDTSEGSVQPAAPDKLVVPLFGPPLVGRDGDLAALAQLIRQRSLVTVVGPAGIGKTSLAIAAMHEQLRAGRKGAAWVELSRVSDPALVPLALAQALKIKPPPGVEVCAAILPVLKDSDLLLVLDNVDHVVEAVARIVDQMLPAAPGTTWLVTSRSPLKLKAERLFRVPPLAVPASTVSVGEARGFGAVALFESRIQALDRRFALDEQNLPLAIDICRHVDGIPLAIEFAAGRVPLLGLHGVADRIRQRFRLLRTATNDVPERQQTLLAALDWSHDLLERRERKLLYRLGVFTGGFSLQAATAVAWENGDDEWTGIDALATLVDRSLVEVDECETPRYRLLECIREYALLKLCAVDGEEFADRQAHANAMLGIIDAAEAQSWTQPEAAWLSSYALDLDNVRAALEWSLAHDRRLAIALLGAARGLFVLEGEYHELRCWCGRVVSIPRDVPPAALARYWSARSESTLLARRDLAHRFALHAAKIYRELRDDRGLYLALAHALRSSPGRTAREIVDEMKALERPAWPARVQFEGRRAQVDVAMLEGRIQDKSRLLDDMLQLAHACDAPRLVQRTLVAMADHALAVGDVARAIERGRELLRMTAELRDYQWLIVSVNLANALLQSGSGAEARAVITRYLKLSPRAVWDGFFLVVPVFALLAASEGRCRSAARLLGFADRSTRAAHWRPEPNEARAYELAISRVRAALDEAECRREMATGEWLDVQAVCALTLETSEGSTTDRGAPYGATLGAS